MKMQYGKQRQAVAPVLATLLMIAVAVAMSVIIFMWSQGFLSQTSSATGGQQGAQNQAAQSSIAIESATFVARPAGSINIIVRNVGAVSVTLGSLQLTGSSSNADFAGSIIVSTLTASTVTPSEGTWTYTPYTPTLIQKGSSVTLTLASTTAACTNSGGTAGTCTTTTSGDVVNVKVTTNVGTFAQAQFTVP